MAYITEAYLMAFASGREIDLYQYEPAKVAASLTVAADYIDAYYKFCTPLSSYTTLPEPIQRANAMAAIYHLEGKLLIDPSANANGAIKSEEKELKGMVKKVSYDTSGAALNKPRTPLIDGLLKPYLCSDSVIQAFSVGRRC